MEFSVEGLQSFGPLGGTGHPWPELQSAWGAASVLVVSWYACILCKMTAVRFPSGFKALGDYLHARNISFGFYTAESTGTCGGYPASRGYEDIDAASFAKWVWHPARYPVRYPAGYPVSRGYKAIGAANVSHDCAPYPGTPALQPLPCNL